MAFHFLPLEYQLGAELLAELREVSSLPGGELVKLAALCMNYMTNSNIQAADFIESLEAIEVPVKTKENAARSLLLFFKLAGKKVMGSNKIAEDLRELGFPDQAVEEISEIWDQKKVVICQNMLGEVVAAQQLVDVEWKFGLTVGNMLTDRKGECFLQIKLVIKQTDGHLKDVYFELTPRQFYELYGELEKIQTLIEIHSN